MDTCNGSKVTGKIYKDTKDSKLFQINKLHFNIYYIKTAFKNVKKYFTILNSFYFFLNQMQPL